MEGVIKTVNLRKVYKIGNEKVVALDCINLEIARGQVCCILGTSGSGKSTLLNQLAGLEKPTRGEVWIKGKKISTMSEKQLAYFRQRNIGFVFQSYNLLQGMSGVDNVAMPLTFRGIGKRKRVKLAKEMLQAVGLGKRMLHKPNEMSGGQQQRVGIARAFVAKPDVVFADEPTGNLDTRTTREVMDLFLQFAREKQITIVLVTHDQFLAKYADRIVTIVDGNVISDELNHSLFDVTRELTQTVQGALEQQDYPAAARVLLRHAADFAEGVAVQALECALKGSPTDKAQAQSLLDAATDEDARKQLARIVEETGILEEDEAVTAAKRVTPVLTEVAVLPVLPPLQAAQEPLELVDATADEPEDTATDEPEETAADEPEETATDEPEETAADEPEDTAADEPEETAADEPEDTATDEPEDTAADEPEDTPPETGDEQPAQQSPQENEEQVTEESKDEQNN